MNKNPGNKTNICFFLILSGAITAAWVFFFPWFRDVFISQYFFMPPLGLIAATIANATPAGAGIVYFPVLTRTVTEPVQAVRFSLMIQAYGMSLGALKWYVTDHKLFLIKEIAVTAAAGIAGITCAVLFMPVQNPPAVRLLFNAGAFAMMHVIFVSSSRGKKTFTGHRSNSSEFISGRSSLFFLVLFSAGFAGGIISGWIGFGIDTIFFFIMTLLYKKDTASAIVSSVVLMAVVSLFGTLINIVFFDVNTALWFSAIPGVTLGALFAAVYLSRKIGQKNILLMTFVFLSLNFIQAVWFYGGGIDHPRLCTIAAGAACMYTGYLIFRMTSAGKITNPNS